MNTSALKSFAQQARTLLREGVERRLIYWGFDKNGKTTAQVEGVAGGYTFRGKVSDDNSVPAKWNKLKAAIAQTSFDEVVEKAAYTWFNRLLAMKILSKNGYETAQLDYLSDETLTPAILERARRGLYSFLTNKEKQRLQTLLTDYEKEQEAFAILLIGYCHQHPLLQAIFGSIDDYTELLLPDDLLTENGFLNYLNTTEAISDDDYKQVELIGWLYQFYISEKKDEVFAGFKKNKKAEAKDIPAATQIFTPNWIVKYLVQNTIGRTWLEAHPESDLKSQWQYLVEPSGTSSPPKERGWNGALEELTFLDPAVGSGHILVEAFDVLYPMYLTEYYTPEEAVQSILEKNLFGLDLDLRAAQLAQFAVILKAAQYSRVTLQGKMLPHIYAMPPQRTAGMDEVVLFLGKENAVYANQLYKAFHIMEQSNNLGSIMALDLSEDGRKAVEDRYTFWQQKAATNIEEEIIKGVLLAYIPILLILTNRFACVGANPPYMGQSNMNGGLKNYISLTYPDSKTDLMTVFMEVALKLLEDYGKMAMINLPSWMFLSSFEKLRSQLVSNNYISSLVHLGRGVFGSDFGSVTFSIDKNRSNGKLGVYRRLFKEHVTVDSVKTKETRFFDKNYGYFEVDQRNFCQIPGSPIAYWISDKMLSIFSEGNNLSIVSEPKFGMSVGDGNLFLKQWSEISFNRILFDANSLTDFTGNKKWAPIDKGGQFRRWYGNQEMVVNWENDGYEIRNHPKSAVRSPHFFLQPHNSWTLVTAGSFSSRYFPKGFLLDTASNCVYFNGHNNELYLLGLLNSRVSDAFLNIINPTINYSCGVVGLIPYCEGNHAQVSNTTSECIRLSKNDWNSRETSWDFQRNPLVALRLKTLKEAFDQWLLIESKNLIELHSNEEKLNQFFIETYDLKDELTPEIALRDITILQDEVDYDALEQLQKPFEGQLVPIHTDVVMQQLISYIVGCYMGRYRLDKPGLNIAHPNPTDEELAPYTVQTGEDKYFQFQIDDDAIIPFMGGNGNFTDDMLHKVKEFLTIVWGDAGLTANLNFLQQLLGKDLEDYLVKDFWKYHLKTYSKKPIYWLFASKKGAFQVLVYMHRMNAFTLVKIRSKYLIPHISWLQHAVADMEKKAATLSRAELKKLDTYRKQLAECEQYDLLLKDMADKQISFDLDDGVARNYALFEGVVAEIK